MNGRGRRIGERENADRDTDTEHMMAFHETRERGGEEDKKGS